ncbi:MAG: MlaD family protein [Actinomycetota bacterium]|nr:MlaD family protein [Actinomycetota bacterium]
MSLWIKLGVLTAAGMACLAVLAVQIGQLGGAAGALADTYPVVAHFDDATGVTDGNEIRLAGVRVGKVGSVAVERGEAVVTMNIDERYRVPQDSRFELRWKNLLGQRFIQVVPPPEATPGGPAVEEGAELTTARTRSAADLSMLLNNTEPLVAQLDVPRLNQVTATLAASFAGREAALGAGIDDARTLLTELNTRRDAIDRSLANLDTLIGGIAERDAEIERFLTSFATTAETLAANAGQLGLTVAQLDVLVDVTEQVLSASSEDLDAVIDQSVQVLDAVAANADSLEEGVRTLPWAVAAITRATGKGNWWQVYARGLGGVTAFVNEPVIGPDHNDVGVDDQTAPDALLGEPRVPLPPIPETQLGPVTLNPSPQTRAERYEQNRQPEEPLLGGLGTLLNNLLGGGS